MRYIEKKFPCLDKQRAFVSCFELIQATCCAIEATGGGYLVGLLVITAWTPYHEQVVGVGKNRQAVVPSNVASMISGRLYPCHCQSLAL